MDLYQDVFFRCLDILRNRNTISRLYFLRESQYWPQEILLSYQLERLNSLLFASKTSSSFYKERLKYVELPLKSIQEIQKIPILTKEDIRSNFKAIVNNDIAKNRGVAGRTGGSTGEPTHYYWDKRGMDWNRGCVYRSAEWAGVRLGEKTVQMSGSHYDYSNMQQLSNKIVYFLQRYKDLSVAYFDDELAEKYTRIIEEFQPTSIWGYSSGISHFSQYILDRSYNRKVKNVKALVTSSENLTQDMRQTINAAFSGVKVFDHYGSREMYIASECSQHDGYHIHSEVILCEIVDSKGNQLKPGEMGRVILTDLTNYVFPFIRYEIGDVATLAEEKSCPCGIQLPKLAGVDGRIADLLILKNRVLTPPNITILMSDFKGVENFQIKQPSIDRLEVLIVPGKEFSSSFKDYIATAMQDLVRNEATVNIKFVDHIEVSESGKRRFIISDVAKEYV